MAASVMSSALSTAPICSRSAALAMSAVFATLAGFGLLGAILGVVGSLVLGQACAIGAVEMQGIDPALFHNLISGGLLACSAGVLGLLRPRAA